MEDRAPVPWSEEAELAVLGAMLMDDEARRVAEERLQSDDFHREAHRRIYSAFERLNGRGQALDVVTLSDELKSRDELEAAGGYEYLARLVDAVPTAANVEHHVEVLRDKATLRRLVEAGGEIRREAAESAAGASAEAVTRARDLLREVEERAAVADRDGLLTAREILDDPDARRTPVTVVDRLAWREEVVMVAGREKGGKSTLVRWAAARASAGRRAWEEAPRPEGPARVLYWGQERAVDVAADLDRMGADLDQVWIRDMRLVPGDRFAALKRDAEEVQPDLLAVDTLSTFADAMELDPGASTDWEPVMNRLGALAQETGAAVLFNHHARKSDGEYRDSTAIGAGVDAWFKFERDPAEGDRVRKLTANPRSAVPARDFRYSLAGTEAEPRLELLDGSLSLEERVQRFVRDHPGCSQRDVREGVRGREADVVTALRELCEDGGPLVCDDSTTPYQYRTREDPRGTGTEPARNRSGTGGVDGGGRSGSRHPLSPHRGEGAGTAGRVDGDENAPRRCACGNRIGPNATTCGSCKKRRSEVLDRLPDPSAVEQVGEAHPTSPRRTA